MAAVLVILPFNLSTNFANSNVAEFDRVAVVLQTDVADVGHLVHGPIGSRFDRIDIGVGNQLAVKLDAKLSSEAGDL